MTMRHFAVLSVLLAAVAAAQPAPPNAFLPTPLVKAAGGMIEGGRLSVTLGKERTPVKLQPQQTPAGSRRWDYMTGQPLAVSVTFTEAGRCTVWDVACTNTGPTQQWLELGPELLLQRTGPLNVFDGWDDVADPQQPHSLARLAGSMPLTCAWNAQTCVAVGFAPTQLVSYLRHEYEPLPDAKARLATLTRTVLDPGQSETVRFVSLAAPGEWGKYEAFEAYYDSFPTSFVARPDVDPRASLGSAMYSAWPPTNWSPETVRRLYGGWDWCYAPFRRTGDTACRPEFWDYTPARPMDRTRSLPREQYLAWRQKAFADGAKRCDVGMMFYICSQTWCEEKLARERYADALTTDPSAKVYFDTPWCTGHDNELRMFPYMTSFGEQSRKDIADVARDLDLAGFAFDTAGDGCRYLGPALPKLPHRAWDDRVGVYCDESIAVTSLMDYVHTLKKNGQTLAVVSNPMSYGTYASCVHSDSAMLEANPWNSTRENGDRLRWKMGHKTLVWWEGYELEDFVDPSTITKDQLTRVYQGLADFTLLQSLRVGFIPPTMYTSGQAKLTRWLPAITDCVQAGWQPVPAARVPAPLWSSRYGRHLGTKIAVAHETGAPVAGDVTIENARIGKATYLFSGTDGAEMTNRIVKGETVIPLSVPVRTPVLLQAQLAVTGGALREATVSTRMGVTGGTLTAVLSGTGTVGVDASIPWKMRIASATVDGQPVKGPWSQWKFALKPQTKLVVNFVSNPLALGETELLDFPFLKEGKPNVTLVIPKGASERTRHAAFRLQEYFRYWTGYAQQPPAEVLLPIVEEGTAVPGPVVRFALTPKAPARVTMQQGNLVVSGPNEDRLLEVTFDLLRALDSKYWFPGRLPATVLNVRVGLANTVIE